MNPDSREELDRLVSRLMDERLSGEEAARLDSLLAESSDAVRRYHEQLDNQQALCAIYPGDVYESSLHSAESDGAPGVPEEFPASRSAGLLDRDRRRSVLLTLAASLVVLLSVGLYVGRSDSVREVATIVEIDGSVVWTGDGGRVVHDLRPGQELSGGIVEGVAPGSWIQLEFRDGSTLGLLGNSVLTFSDLGQKRLHLKRGKLTCDIRAQPARKPLIIHTRSALLEVLGTRFEVDAELSTTVLDVREGVVRLKRLSDGDTVDVPALHRAIAAADGDVTPELVPDSVSQWRSQLALGPDYTQGRWLPPCEEGEASLRSVPYVTPQGKTIYTVAFGVSRGGQRPVLLLPGSRLRVRGRLASATEVYFGVTVQRPGGGFAGRFQTVHSADSFRPGEEFEVLLELDDFRLDVSLEEMEDRLPGTPFQSIVESFWCHSLFTPAGLEISSVELIPPARDR